MGFIINPHRLKALSANDPHWSSVVLLMGFDDGIVDEAKGRAFTVNSAPQLSAIDPLIGTKSILFDGVDDYIYTADADDLDLPSDFTVECFAKTGSGLTQTMISKGEGGAGPYSYSMRLEAGKMGVTYANKHPVSTVETDYITQLGTNTFHDNTRHHLVWTRSGVTFRMFADGLLEAQRDWAPALYNNAVPLHIGCRYAMINAVRQQFFSGRMDEIRITKGVGRYTAPFTPPTTFFPRS